MTTNGISSYNFSSWTPTGDREADLKKFMEQNPNLSREEAIAALNSHTQSTSGNVFGEQSTNMPQNLGEYQSLWQVPNPQTSQQTVSSTSDIYNNGVLTSSITAVTTASDIDTVNHVQCKARDEDEFTGEKMSLKEAKEWVRFYRGTHGCSRKEARTAFKEKFGYHYPGNFANVLLTGFLAIVAPPAAVERIHPGILDIRRE